MGVYEKIKNIAKEKSLSITKIEDDLGFTHGYLSRWRNGNIVKSDVQKLADYLGVEIEEITTEFKEENVRNDIYNFICDRCEELGKTIDEMSASTGVHMHTFNSLKYGSNKSLSAKNLYKVSQYLGVTMEQIMTCTKENANIVLSGIDKSVIESYRKLSDDGRKIIDALVKKLASML